MAARSTNRVNLYCFKVLCVEVRNNMKLHRQIEGYSMFGSLSLSTISPFKLHAFVCKLM